MLALLELSTKVGFHVAHRFLIASRLKDVALHLRTKLLASLEVASS